MLFTSVLAALALPLGVFAQAGLNISAISPCIISCSTIGAATGGCASFADYACICTSTVAQEAVAACLQANCTATDVATSYGLQNQTCATLNTTSDASASVSGLVASATAAINSAASAGASGAASASAAVASATKAATGAGFQMANTNSLLALGGAIFVGAGALLL